MRTPALRLRISIVCLIGLGAGLSAASHGGRGRKNEKHCSKNSKQNESLVYLKGSHVFSSFLFEIDPC